MRFDYSYWSAKMPAAADPVTIPAKWAVPTSASQYWFSLHVIDHSCTMVFSFSSYTHRLHAISRFCGSSRPHSYQVLFSYGSSYRKHCSGVNNPDVSTVPGTEALTHGWSYFGLSGSSQPGTKHLYFHGNK